MKIGFLLSSLGGSPLQGGLWRGLSALGHDVQGYACGQGYDLLLVFNQVAHCRDYEYPPFPSDYRGPMAFIDAAEYGYFTRLPDRAARYANMNAEGAQCHDTKNAAEQWKLWSFLEGRSFPYFIREMAKCVPYPASYHPIDYPLYYESHCGKHPNRNEYMRRELDLFVSWGASHPWRLPITQALRDAHTKCEVNIIEENGHPRLHQKQIYFPKTEGAKCSVSYDGYGSGSFRMTEVLVRTVLLQCPLSIVTRCPLVDGETCVGYSVESEGEEFRGTNVAERLRWVLDNPDAAFEIYERGFHHCMAHLTERATAQYVLDTVAAHDWNSATQLEVGHDLPKVP